MKTNTHVTCLLADGVTEQSVPGYRVPGCFFVIREVTPDGFTKQKPVYLVCCPHSKCVLAHCQQFQTACHFSQLLHDIILEKLPEYAKADLDGCKAIWESVNLRSFYHLRLYKPGQFRDAYFQQLARNAEQA